MYNLMDRNKMIEQITKNHILEPMAHSRVKIDYLQNT